MFWQERQISQAPSSLPDPFSQGISRIQNMLQNDEAILTQLSIEQQIKLIDKHVGPQRHTFDALEGGVNRAIDLFYHFLRDETDLKQLRRTAGYSTLAKIFGVDSPFYHLSRTVLTPQPPKNPHQQEIDRLAQLNLLFESDKEHLRHQEALRNAIVQERTITGEITDIPAWSEDTAFLVDFYLRSPREGTGVHFPQLRPGLSIKAWMPREQLHFSIPPSLPLVINERTFERPDQVRATYTEIVLLDLPVFQAPEPVVPSVTTRGKNWFYREKAADKAALVEKSVEPIIPLATSLMSILQALTVSVLNHPAKGELARQHTSTQRNMFSQSSL